MLTGLNSNFKQRTNSIASDNQQNTPLLLKPTGVPVFTPVPNATTGKDQARDFNQTIAEAQSTMENTMKSNGLNAERTVRAKSFVIGKKVENTTGINLIDLEKITLPTEKQFPAKVLYVRPSHEHKPFTKPQKEEISQKKISIIPNQNKENSSLNKFNLELLNKETQHLPLDKDFPKQNAVSDQKKVKELKHRPKSSTTQQIKKESIKHSKLGPTTSVKPQISFVKKVQTAQRPQTAPPKSKNKEDKSLERNKKQMNESPPKVFQTEIPFNQNRFQGKYENITQDLIKKAQEALKEEKLSKQRQIDEMQQKLEKQKQMSEEVKKKNSELVQKQKEKGVERIDFRKREEEQKILQRKEENRKEREKQKELRKKRKEEGRNIIGLETVNQKAIDEYRKQVQDKIKKELEVLQPKQIQPEKPKPEKLKLNKDQYKLNFNQDLSDFAIQDKDSLFKLYDKKDLQQMLAVDSEEAKLEAEKQTIKKKKLVQEQIEKRRLEKQEQERKAEEEKAKKAESLRKLQEQIQLQKEAQQKSKELKLKIEQEREQLEKELEEMRKKGKKIKKSKKKQQQTGSGNHQEQLDQLRNWIDDQINKEEEKLMNDSSYINQGQEQPSKIIISIDKKKPSNNSSMDKSAQPLKSAIKKSQSKQKAQREKDQSDDKILNFDFPGNNDINYQDNQKFEAREDRYGIFSDNGFGKAVNIKKDQLNAQDHVKPNQNKSKDQSNERTQDLKLSEEGINSIINRIQEFQRKKEQEIQNQSSQNNIIEQQINEENSISRKVIFEKQSPIDSYSKKPRDSSVPGIVNLHSELERQQQERKKKELSAVIVIQKWSRGYLDRAYARELREDKRAQIEAEYGYFEDQVKFNAEYNIQKFLKGKQKLREDNKTKALADSLSIQEKIGDSSNSQSKSLKPGHVQVQNYFREKSDKDPLSLIEIFARKNAPKIVPAVVKSPVKAEKQSIRRGHKQSQQSDIEEDIYTESFEEEDVGKQHSSEIEEDIIEVSKGMSSGSFKDPQMKKQPFSYKQSASIVDDSIQEDLLMSVMSKSKTFKSPDRKDQQSSIIEESGLQHYASMSKSSNKRESIAESIKEEYDQDGFNSYSGSADKFKIQLEKQKQIKDRQQQQNQMVAEFEKKITEDQRKRKEYVHELLDEMKRYEQASVSTVVVERMEKIITQSLAQKDKLLMGQRLHELELEKNHKDEINKIREEQIRLMSLLMLQGGGGAGSQPIDEEAKQKALDEIKKIIDKPIVIQQVVEPVAAKKQPARKDDSVDEDDFEEKSDIDYIEESRGLQQKIREVEDEDSIKTSFIQSESIVDEVEDKMSQIESEDEIKESIHINGKKLQQQKEEKKDLEKMRMALGSEEAIRQQSKQALKNGKHSQQQDLKGSCIFDKHSFQDFTSKRFKELLFDPSSLDEVVHELEDKIDRQRIKDEEKLKKEYRKNLISPRTFKKRNLEIEKWVENQRFELSKNKRNLIQNMNEMGSVIKNLDKDKKSMIEKIGSPRHSSRKQLDSQHLSASLSVDYEDIEEESNDSLRVRQARDQLKKITQAVHKEEVVDPVAKEIEKKRVTAKKLFEEKEKAIEEGLKNKLRNFEKEQADKMLNLALNIDINKEIDKRINGAKRAIEESSERFEEFSARSYSQSLGVLSEDPRKKKKVNFASPERFSSLHSQDQSSAGGSSHFKSTHKIEESIGESIKIEESYNMSQHTNQISESIKRSQQSKDKVIDSIPEDSEHYSDDFIQSQISDSKSSKVTIQNQLAQSRNKLIAKADSQQDDDIEYSMNFDESIGQSQQLSELQKPQKQSQQIEKVDEESEDQEEEKSEESNRQVKDSLRESEDIQEEELVSESISSSKVVSSNAAQEAQEVLSDDKEVQESVKSIEWVINFDQPESQRSKKPSDDEYSDAFEEIDEESKQEEEEDFIKVDELEDLESYPEDNEQSLGNQDDKIDKITDEFLNLLLEEIKNNEDLKIDKILREEDFADKFPFNLQQKIEEEVKLEPPKIITPAPEEKKHVPKPEPKVDEVREKFEKLSKIQQDNQRHIEQYLSLLISNIDKRQLIDLLEKPINTDPLKKLASIFSQENVEESFNHMNESALGPQSMLSLDFFVKMEDLYQVNFGRKEERVDLTESAKQSYLKHDNIHHKALFDSFNQALDIERPYRDKGKPAPWSKQTRVLKPKITMNDVENTLQKAKQRVLDWSKTQAGTKIAPLPPPPPNNDMDNHAIQAQLQSEEERINQAREDKLGVLMVKELEDNEQRWIDYEDEDTQVKFDIADMVLEELASELAQLMLNNMKPY